MVSSYILIATALLLSASCTTGFLNAQIGSSLARTTGARTHLLAQSFADDDQQLQLSQPTRRQFYQSVSSSIFATSVIGSMSPPAANAESTSLETYTDADYGFRLSTPTDWKKSIQTLSGRRKAVFFTQDSSDGIIDTLMIIAYTPIRDDFTSLASFGSVDAVAQATILPKGELGGTSDESKMLSAVSKKNSYYFDYVTTPVVPVEAGSGSGSLTKQLKPMHFRTIFTLVPLKTGAGSTLVTITVQTSEEKYQGLKGKFDEIIDSFDKA